jgi:glycosyltransferase involved in cell wall biosynthesis
MDSSPNNQIQPLGFSSTWEPSHSCRVLMLAPTSFFADYGCHVRILEEARILRQLGHDVTIATYHNGGPVADLDIRRTLPVPWRRDYEVGSSRHKVVFDALLGWKALTLLARERYDVIHAHLHEGALIGQVLNRLFGLPLVFDFQGSLTGEMIDHQFVKQGSASYRALLRLETWLDRSSPMIVTSSEQAAQLLRDRFGCRSERVQILPDCVNSDIFRPAASYDPGELAVLRQHLGIPSERRLIVYLGLLADYQGTGLLLEALQRLVWERQAAHLLLMGFPNVEFYRARAQTLGIDDFVTFTGRVPYDEAPKHLALGDVAVAPKLSLTEGAGKLLNYMAVGLPTVAFDTPVARQYLGIDGLFAERGDVASLTDQLRAALFPSADSGRRYARIGWQLRQRAIQHFGWEPAGRQIVDIYRELLGETADRPTSKPKWAVSGK